ncbi:MAG TPA: DUF4037 domain-containing protein [Roseiflexaceae bacterium]|nr:DUF4037 domain-containing protein [Roseiflexaceae bacterium]
MPEFIPGLELSLRFYHEAVRPILEARFPGLRYAAARIGPGSEVLGFDTPMSTDHDWGPAVSIFLRDEDADLAPAIDAALAQGLPQTFAGYPVLVEPGTDAPGAEPAPRHRAVPETLRAFVRRHLAHELGAPLTPADWLTIPSQKLRELTAGAVHHDDVGELTALRERLAFYPHDIWLYLLAGGWNRIGQEEHLMGRAGYVGDELGSALIGARLARDVMSLCFLMERQYAPYPKWFGAAFQRLCCAVDMAPALWQAQRAATWREREAALCAAYERLAAMHNALGITPPVPATASPFFNRPFQVIWGGQVAGAIRKEIADPEVRRIAARPLIGGIDQWSDSTDLRSDPAWRAALRRLYE